jgi:hypothetical protein
MLRVTLVLAVLAGMLATPQMASSQALPAAAGASDSASEPYFRDVFSLSDAPVVPAPERFSLGVLGQRLGVGPLDVGVTVARRRPSLELDATGSGQGAGAYRLSDTELRTTDIGVDLRLRWPSMLGEPTIPVQPYLSLGPAVSLATVDELPLGVGTSAMSRRETTMSLGMRGAVGLTWQLSTDASVFGEYRLTQDRPLGTRGAGERGLDLFYGFSLRF